MDFESDRGADSLGRTQASTGADEPLNHPARPRSTAFPALPSHYSSHSYPAFRYSYSSAGVTPSTSQSAAISAGSSACFSPLAIRYAVRCGIRPPLSAASRYAVTPRALSNSGPRNLTRDNLGPIDFFGKVAYYGKAGNEGKLGKVALRSTLAEPSVHPVRASAVRNMWRRRPESQPAMVAPLATSALSALTRAQLAARVTLLRDTLDRMADQVALDGGPGFDCRGSIKVSLIMTEGMLRSKDRLAEGRPA